MCLIAWRWEPANEVPLILVANRDEFYARPTNPLAQWENSPIWAGRDLEGGGTWLGVTPAGRVAALTNYRDPSMIRSGTPSRGDLVREFLEGELSAESFVEMFSHRASAYNPFNLMLFDESGLWACESRVSTFKYFKLQPGVGSISNAEFNSPWPKMNWLRDALAHKLTGPEASDDTLLALLLNEETAPDGLLPSTGIPVARERSLSSPFIRLDDYGTRACSLVRVGKRETRFIERTFDVNGFVSEVSVSITRGQAVN
jgi:uncharacterized protein with NRDE domain